jgi:hypothetical protein
MGWDFSLSPSKIGVLKDCVRCFYDAEVLKIARPRGIFPSLPGGVDLVMKNCFDANRSAWLACLQTEMQGKTLWGTVDQINKLRNWRSGLKCTITVKGKVVSLIGALDDLVIEPDQSFSPFDTKTKGKEPSSDGSEYYQSQLDLYALMLRENGMKPSGVGYLNYWFPVQFEGGTMQWSNKLYTLNVSSESGALWLAKAVDVLTGSRPAETPGCEYCKFVSAHMKGVANGK